MALLKFKGLTFIDKLRYSIHVFYSLKINNFEKLDKQHAIPWLKKWLGDSLYKKLWENLFAYKFYHLSSSVSAAWIWSRIKRIGSSRYNLMTEKLGYLEGGSYTLLKSLSNFVNENGGKIHLKSPVEEVIIKNNKILGIKVGNITKKFDEVISTIPIPYVPKIIPNLPDNVKNLKPSQM